MNARIFDRPLSMALLAALLLAGAAACLEQGTAGQRAWRGLPSPLSRPVPDRLTRFSLLAALGDEARSAADWAYIDCLQYLGDKANALDGFYRKALPLYREVLWLDPGFGHAGREGVAVLGWFLERPKEAVALIGDARAWNPAETRYPVYLAALSYKERLDLAGTVEALRPEIMRPDAPEMLLRMVGNIYLKAGDWEGARTYWRWILSRAKTDMTREMARRSLRKAAAGLAGKVEP